MTALSATGKRRLASFEQTITDGLATFEKVGNALISIREERLYRDEYDDFEAYCLGRWKFTAGRARQLMQAAEIATVVSVSNEAQARALAPIKDDPAALREVVEQAKADGNTSAPNLSKYVKNFKDTQIEGETGVEGDPAVVDAGPCATGDGANGHDVGRGEPEPVSPLPPVALVPDEVSMPCPHCGGTGVLVSRAS